MNNARSARPPAEATIRPVATVIGPLEESSPSEVVRLRRDTRAIFITPRINAAAAVNHAPCATTHSKSDSAESAGEGFTGKTIARFASQVVERMLLSLERSRQWVGREAWRDRRPAPAAG